MSERKNLAFRCVRGLLAIAIALGVAAVFIFLSSKGGSLAERLAATGDALVHLLVRPLVRAGGGFNTKNFTDVLAGMIPILFTGISVCVMFSAEQFNMGAEGGTMLGAFVAGLCAVYLPMSSGLHAVVCLLAGALAVALVMLVPAILKARLGVSEMVSSLMLNYVILYAIKFVLNTFLADRSKGQTQTFPFLDGAKLPQLVDNGSRLSVGFVLALVCVALVTLFLYRTRWGYSIRMVGLNGAFATYSGLPVTGVILLSQVLGGALAGLGGAAEMLGRYDTFSWGNLPGYGWTGITVAILANNNPAFVPLAAFFIAYLDKGCNLMSTYCGVPAQLISILQAVIFLFFAAERFLAGFRQRLVVREAARKES